LGQGTAYKSVLKNAAYIFFIKLFPAFASIVILILFSRDLSPSDYGHYQSFWIKWLLIGTLAYAGLPVTIITYAPDVLKHFFLQFTRKQYLLFFCWVLLWAAVFSYFQTTELSMPVALSAGLLVLYAIHSIQESLLMAAKKMKGLLTVNFLYAVYFFLVHMQALQQFDLSRLLSLILAGMLVRAAILSFLTVAVYRNIRIDQSAAIAIKNARSLWLHLGFYDLLQNIFRFIDKFILSIFLSAALYAVYFNGSQTAEVPLLPYLLGAVASSVLIQLSNDKIADKENAFRLMNASGKLLSCIVFPLFFFLLFFGRELFVVLLSEKYLSSVAIFTVAIFVLPLRAYNFTLLLQHFHRGALINKGALLDLFIALTLMYPMYQLFQLPGIALSFVISTYVQVCYYLYHIRKITGASVGQLLPLRNWLVKLLFFGLVLFCVYCLASGLLHSKANTLFLGVLVMAILSVVTLRQEYKALKK